jgi:hypothetical protein
MTPKKTKADIFWLPEDQYKKAMFHFSSVVNQLLLENFDLYGLGANIPGVLDGVNKAAVDLSLVLRGIDKPIKVK